MKNQKIQKFLTAVRKRLNRGLAWKVLAWSVLIAGLSLIAHASVYRLKGMAVPWEGTLVISSCILIIGAATWLTLLRSSRESAVIADRQLKLKDSLTSAMEFEGNHDEVHQLQLKQTEKLLGDKNPRELPLKFPGRPLASGVVLAALAIGLGFLPNSDAVQSRLDQEVLTENRSEEIKSELAEYVEELIKEMSADEKEVLTPEELRKWVDDLKRTKNQKEAMRQLARFEQKVSDKMSKMEARKDEETMKAAAAELAKSDQSTARQLGKKLDLKEFKMAAEDLEKLSKAAKLKDPKKMDPAELKKKMEELKQLREATKRMADAARKRGIGQKKKLGEAANKMAPGNPKNKMKQGNPDGKMAEGDAQEMAELMEAMDADAKALQDEMAKEDWEDCDWEKCGKCQGQFDKNLKKFNQKLSKMNGQKLAKRRLAALRAGLSKAQCFANGQCEGLGLQQGLAKGKGGRKAGVGTDSSKRSERDASPEVGNVANLEGQKGSGPSITAVEEADSGTGISGRSGETKAREFRRQMESFVRRDDVPEDVKMGVKEYFERVHEVSETK